MFYNTSDPDAVNGDGACDSVMLSGGADASFTPPADGLYKDILFFQDRSCTAAFTHVGNGQITTGIYYLPTAQFRMTGTSDTGGKQIIADTVNVAGNADVTVNSGPYLTEVYAPLRLIE